MSQTVLCVVLEVQPASAELLRTRITAFREQQKAPNASAQDFDDLRSAVPMLHFMSMTVFEDAQYDPVFIMEINFDGRPDLFWASIAGAIGHQLRDLLRCCKCPRDGKASLFNAITEKGSTAGMAPLLAALATWPEAGHQGNRGLDRARILEEGILFQVIQTELNDGDYRNYSAADIHARLRKTLLSGFPSLAQPAAPRITIAESLADWIRFIGFACTILLLLSLPGLILALLAHYYRPDIVAWPQVALAAFSSVVATFVAALARLLWKERHDPTLDAPAIDEVKMRNMAEREDKIAQNHMVSIVHIKPGMLRGFLLRAGLRGMGFYLRVFRHDGYLENMRTIHFAQWSLVSNGSRLMFNSNFDGSWDSYLDDFIEKASKGVTLAWTNCVGFPATRALVFQGSANGRMFKAWARHSMVESPIWFSAYKEYSVNQIERHARIANGLRKPVLNNKEATLWILDL
jgi:hypothetical protein